jgi:serine protease
VKRVKWCLALLLVVLLVACGGGSDDPPDDGGDDGNGGGEATASISGRLLFPGFVEGITSNTSGDIVPGEVLVSFAGNADIQTQSINSLQVADTSFSLARTLGGNTIGLYRAHGISVAKTWQLIARLQADPMVSEAIPNRIYRVMQEPDEYCTDFPEDPGCEDGVFTREECLALFDDTEFCADFPSDAGGEPGDSGGDPPDDGGGDPPGDGGDPPGDGGNGNEGKTPNDTQYNLMWHYEAFNLPRAWQIEDGTSNEVVVAVLDTGTVQHPDLVDNLLPGYNFVDGEEGPDPSEPNTAANLRGSGFHGEHVAGTIAATTNNMRGVAGVSWGAKVIHVRVLGAQGGTTEGTIRGAEWAAGNPLGTAGIPENPNPAKVINMSLGTDDPTPCSQMEERVFAGLSQAGVFIVAAAGNENRNVTNSAPANCNSVFSVGATGPDNRRAPYSNYGTTLDVMAPGGDTNEILNRGGRQITGAVLSTTGDGNGGFTYKFYDGTSMASPHIAGLAALMFSQNPDVTAAEVRSRIINAARPMDAEACNRPQGNECGAGLVDAAAALTILEDDQTPSFAPLTALNTTRVPTFVDAFFCLDSECEEVDFDLDISPAIEVETTGDAVPYIFENLRAGTYEIVGWQDIDQDEEVDDDEPFGFTDPIELAEGQDLENIDVRLEALTIEDEGFENDEDIEPQSQRIDAKRARVQDALR